MPYVLPFDEEEEQQQQNQGQVFSGPALMTPESAQNRQPGQSGNFTNLQAFLDAQQGQNFGGEFAGKVGEEVQKGQQAKATAESGFKQRADQGSTSYDEPFVSGLLNRVSAPGQDHSVSDQDYNKFKSQRDATYQGPNSLVDTDLYDPAYKAVNKGLEASEASKTEGGKLGLLGRYYGKPGYSSGQKNLDLYLSSVSPNSRQAFSQVQNQGSQLGGSWSDLQGALDQYAQGRKALTQSTQDTTRQLLGGAKNNLVRDVEQGTANKRSAKRLELTGLKDALKAGDLSASQNVSSDTAERTGLLGARPVTRLFDIDISDPKYFQMQDPNTLSSYVSDEQEAMQAALKRLGDTGDFLPTERSNYSDPMFTYDRDALDRDRSLREAQYEGELGQLRRGNAFNVSSGQFGTFGDVREGLESWLRANSGNPNVADRWYQAKQQLDQMRAQEQAISDKYQANRLLKYGGRQEPEGYPHPEELSYNPQPLPDLPPDLEEVGYPIPDSQGPDAPGVYPIPSEPGMSYTAPPIEGNTGNYNPTDGGVGYQTYVGEPILPTYTPTKLTKRTGSRTRFL